MNKWEHCGLLLDSGLLLDRSVHGCFQVRALQCALARYLQDLVSTDAVMFVITQQAGLQDGATPTLLLIKDLLVQVGYLLWPQSLFLCNCQGSLLESHERLQYACLFWGLSFLRAQHFVFLQWHVLRLDDAVLVSYIEEQEHAEPVASACSNFVLGAC